MEPTEFIDACKTGNLIKAKQLHNEEIQTDDLNIAFRWSCCNGNIEIAKWLYELKADIHGRDDSAFRWSCSNGHIEIAKWLYELKANIHAQNDEAFRLSCYRGHTRVVKWLIKICQSVDDLYNNGSLIKRYDIIKVIFESKDKFGKYYNPTNNKMTLGRKQYMERKQIIKSNVSNYIILDLANIVYDFE